MRTKQFRRHQQSKAKSKTKDMIKNVWLEKDLSDNDTFAGRLTSTHRKPCSCSCCSPRKYDRHYENGKKPDPGRYLGEK